MIIKLFGGILIFIFIFFVIGLLLIGKFFTTIFRGGKRQTFTQQGPTEQPKRKSTGKEEDITELFDKDARKKIFNKDEGEYVDFEEVKE